MPEGHAHIFGPLLAFIAGYCWRAASSHDVAAPPALIGCPVRFCPVKNMYGAIFYPSESVFAFDDAQIYRIGLAVDVLDIPTFTESEIFVEREEGV